MGTRLLLAIPVLLALAIASISPSPPAKASSPAPAAAAPHRAPTAPPPTAPPPAAHPPAPQGDETCTCPQPLVWEECEPAWHHDQMPDDAGPAQPVKRAAPGSQDGPI